MADVTEQMTRPELRVALDWFCGCGDPDGAAKAMLDLLEMHPLYERWGEFKERVPGEESVRYVLLYALDQVTGDTRFGISHEGWFEHGSSIGGQWLTPEGERVRDALRREYQLDPDEYGDHFAALFAPHCVHGYDVDDDSHDCMSVDRKLGIESPDDKVVNATLATVAKTLRHVAWQGLTDEDRDQLLKTAEAVDLQGADEMCCPVCEESTCDEDCPLADLRRD